MRLDQAQTPLVLLERAVRPVAAEDDEVARRALRLCALSSRLTKQWSGGQGSAWGFGIVVTVFGIVSVQWWLRFGRCCLHRTVTGRERAMCGDLARWLRDRTTWAVTNGLSVYERPMQRRSCTMHVVETWTSAVVRS